MSFLTQNLPLDVYDEVLCNMVEGILPNVSQPLLLADFLTDSYNLGGQISLMALDGLYHLIHTENLTYPDFYIKLYNRLSPVMLHTQTRATFLELLHKFLSSSYIPDYLVCSFAKRLSYLCLQAPADVIGALGVIVANLVRRYPVCKELIQRPPPLPKEDGSEKIDYYPADSFDVEKTVRENGAVESSLWELKSLQRHFDPKVAKVCMAFNNQAFVQNVGLKTKPPDVRKHLNSSYLSMLQEHAKNKKKSKILEDGKKEYLFKSDNLFETLFFA